MFVMCQKSKQFELNALLMPEHDKPKLKYGFVPWYVFKIFHYIRFVFLHFFLFLPFRSRLIRFVHWSAFCIALFPLSLLHFSRWSSLSGLEPHVYGEKNHTNLELKLPKTLNMRANVDCESRIHFFLLFAIADSVEWKRTCSNLNWQPHTDGINLMCVLYQTMNILKPFYVKILTFAKSNIIANNFILVISYSVPLFSWFATLMQCRVVRSGLVSGWHSATRGLHCTLNIERKTHHKSQQHNQMKCTENSNHIQSAEWKCIANVVWILFLFSWTIWFWELLLVLGLGWMERAWLIAGPFKRFERRFTRS